MEVRHSSPEQEKKKTRWAGQGKNKQNLASKQVAIALDGAGDNPLSLALTLGEKYSSHIRTPERKR